jgi:hypothetical protein
MLSAMLSLLVHAVLGVLVLVLLFRSNPAIYRRVPSGPQLSALEIALYAAAVVSVCVGWYFNIRFVTENTDGWLTNPFVGDGSWQQYMKLLFDNPAAGSASGDFITANVVLLPLVTIVGGVRHGLRRPWLFFVVTLFASFSAGWALYAAALERQRRLSPPEQAPAPGLGSSAVAGGTSPTGSR